MQISNPTKVPFCEDHKNSDLFGQPNWRGTIVSAVFFLFFFFIIFIKEHITGILLSAPVLVN